MAAQEARMAERQKPLKLVLPPSVYREVKKVAKLKDVSMAAVVRQAIKNYLETGEASRASI
jgi:predicted transcriptional regulator